MRFQAFIFYSFLCSCLFGQDPMRGPVNILQGGIVDGVVVPDEVAVRSKVEYEYVRPSDYVWSKRVFSRIDAREKMNFEIFFPLDSFKTDFTPPKDRSQINTPTWCRNQERYSLWTIISMHIMLGDLSVYRVNSPDYEEVLDGYSFKYPIKKNSRDDFFISPSYRNEVTKNIIAVRSAPEIYAMLKDDNTFKDFKKTDKPFKTGNPATGWIDSLIEDFGRNIPELVKKVEDNESLLEEYWLATEPFEALVEPAKTFYLSSESIVAYNIKEDWYFDKERSVLDRRIIAIAPVVRFKSVEEGTLETVIIQDQGISKELTAKGLKEIAPSEVLVERELFWLYFNELRDVLVNYYVYNDLNEAQKMSFDDLFWKRKFSSTIYKVSDKFDRDIEDYKFGVEALYESERVKESIRNWEQDLWNY